MTYDLICVGAGPTGLACAIEAKRAGMSPLVLDKGCLCNSLLHYPADMLFFTTAERMEIGDLPMAISGDKPTRTEALKYYRKAAEHYGLEVRQFEAVQDLTRNGAETGGHFRVRTRRDILAMILRQGMGMVAGGVAIGISLALTIAHAISHILTGVSPSDPLTFAGVPLVSGSVALVACFLPARRATRVDPIVALHSE
jgi:pyridine nucleotide-disulfide oxidoreductase